MLPHRLRPVMGPALFPIIGLVGAGVSAGSQIIGAADKAGALREQGVYQKEVADANARMAESNALDATQRGDLQALDISKKADQVVGAQRAGFAGQGVDVNTGTASDVQGETRLLSGLDRITAKNNAWREAYGYKVEAQNATKKGEFVERASRREADNTFLTGGLNAFSTLASGASTYYRNTRT